MNKDSLIIIPELLNIGFTNKQALVLSQDKFFVKNNSIKKLKTKIPELAKLYNTDVNTIIDCILKFPQFAGLDHTRVLKQLEEVYGKQNKQKLIDCILKHPQFASYGHEHILKQLEEVYGKQNKQKIIDCILKFPQFAGLDHERVLRQKTRIGRLIGLTEQEVIDLILKKPVLAGCSYKRDLAVLDIMRNLAAEIELPKDKEMLNIWTSYISKSPYVPNHNRQRISHMTNPKRMLYRPNQKAQEPPLMKTLRKRLT